MTERKRYNRSVSQLKAYSKCGERFYLERFRRRDLPEFPAPWTALGVGVHEAFCEWEKSDREIDVVEYFSASYDALIETYRELQPDLDQWQIPPNSKDVEKSIKSYRTRGIEKDVPLYRDRCLEAEWEVFRLPSGEKALELEFELLVGDVNLRGAVDMVQWWPERGYATVTDLKTGNLEEWDKRQLGTYKFALQEVYDIPIKHGRNWMLKIDRPTEWYDLSRYTREYLAYLYNALDKGIAADIFLPNPGDHCQLCGVRPWCRENGWKTLD